MVVTALIYNLRFAIAALVCASVKRSSQFEDSGKRIKLRLAEVTELIWDSNMLWKQTSLRRIP